MKIISKKKKEKKNKKSEDLCVIGNIVCSEPMGSFTLSTDYGIPTFDNSNAIAWTTTASTSTINTTVSLDLEADWFNYEDKETTLRKEHPVLQEAWDEYQLLLKLLEDQECDKYAEDRYRGFKK